MRYHWWGFIVNELGEPIDNAEVTIYLAGSDTRANVYFDEYTNEKSSAVYVDNNNNTVYTFHMKTLSNGFYEFWIGDANEIDGYAPTTKFKIAWEKVGVAAGEVDFISILPYYPEIVEVDPNDPDSELRNKLVSNKMIYDIQNDIESLTVSLSADRVYFQGQIDLIQEILRSAVLEVDTLDWTEVGGVYHIDWFHNIVEPYPFVVVYNTDTNKITNEVDVIYTDPSNIRLEATSPLNIIVKIHADFDYTT